VRVKITADMSDSVKQKTPIHCPLFYRGISYAGHQLVQVALWNSQIQLCKILLWRLF